MGQRINYIIKNGDSLTVHYHHWRAYAISADLYLGKERFLEFVRECQIKDQIMDEPWIEGCVIIDESTQKLHFWPVDNEGDTSVVNLYLKELSKKWPGWHIEILKNRMYDVEKVLGIDYISLQEMPEPSTRSRQNIIDDKIEEWVNSIVIILDNERPIITMTGNLTCEQIVAFGLDILPLLKDKPAYELPKEGDKNSYECILIDTNKREILINKSILGLWEYSQHLWPSYQFKMGDFGYLEILGMGGIDTAHLELPESEIYKSFHHTVTARHDYDPSRILEVLTKENPDIQINPDIFDTVSPRTSQVLHNKGLKLDNLFLPAFELQAGEILIMDISAADPEAKIDIQLINIFIGKTHREEISIYQPIKYVEHKLTIKRPWWKKIRRLTVGEYLESKSNPHSNYATKIYQDNRINIHTKTQWLSFKNRTLLSLYATLSTSKNIIFDFIGLGSYSIEETYDIIHNAALQSGVSAIILQSNITDPPDNKTNTCTKIIKLTTFPTSNTFTSLD